MDDPAVESDDRKVDAAAPSTRRRFVVWLVPAIFVLRVLAVDMTGIVSSDSLGYLRRGRDPLGDGFVSQGYRQVAMPTWVWFSDRVGDVAGWDRIFGVAVLQRGLLVLGVLVLWWAMRWWALPTLMVVTSSVYVLHVDFLLPEGLLIPGTFLATGLAAAVVTNGAQVGRRPMLWMASSTAVACWMAAVKLQYASLLLLTAAGSYLLFKDRRVDARRAAASLVVGLVFVAALSTIQAFENKRELGVFEPVSERARAEWYGAYQAVFEIHQENRAKPELAEFFDGGNLYLFLHGIEAREPDYPTRAAEIRERVEQMFHAAGTTKLAEQKDAFVGGLIGGRTDDLAGIIARVRAAPDTPAVRYAQNSLAAEDPQAVLDTRNDGKTPEVVSIEPLVGWLASPFDDYRGWKEEIGVVGLLLTVAGLFVPGRHRPFGIAALVLSVLVAAVLGSAYIDNARYLVGPLTVTMIAGTLGARALVHSRMTRATTAEAAQEIP